MGLRTAGGPADPALGGCLLDDVLAAVRPPLVGGPGRSKANALDQGPVMSDMKGELVVEIPMSALAVLPPGSVRMAQDSSHSLGKMESK